MYAMRLMLVFIILLLAGCGGDVKTKKRSGVQFPTYDDFPGTTVDGAKWTPDTTGGGNITVGGGMATLSVNATSTPMQSTLLFPTLLAPDIQAVQIRMIPVSFNGGTTGSNIRFRYTMRAYQDDVLTGGTNLLSVVFSQLRINNGNFEALVSRCTSDTCGSSSVILGPVILGAVTLNEVYDLTSGWDGNTGFSFLVSGLGTTTLDGSFGGTVTNLGPPVTPRALIEVSASGGTPTTEGEMTVDLDQVNCLKLGGLAC